MYDVNTNPDGSGVYNRTDGVGKWFVPVDRSSGGISILPTTKVPTVASYQLLYQLATPSVEPLTSEGQLTFIEGDNHVEVGTGIVLREHAAILRTATAAAMGDVSAPTKHKINKVLRAYKNSKYDASWLISTINPYGNEKARIDGTNYDDSAAYSLTYLMMEKYPAADIAGKYAENEKALLLDTVKTLQENTTRLSVLESKKAEKDAPAWISPTFVNGWINYSSSYQPAGYYKDSQGIIHLRGLISSGTSGTGIQIFNLPRGYRPKKAILFNIGTSNGTALVAATLEIATDGVVYLGFGGGNTWLSLENISFQAEQ